MTLIPAKNIYEFADIISPETPIRKEDRAFYVDIFPDILETLRDKLIHDNISSQTLFVAGQSGTGKTTALYFLPDEILEQKFHVLHLEMHKYLDVYDANMIDFLIMLGYNLVQESEELTLKYGKELLDVALVNTGKSK